jgi:L-rhamnose mutarotase
MTLHRVVRIMDLHEDAATLSAYDHAHAVGETPAAVVAALHRHGIAEMEVLRSGNRLVMILQLAVGFDPEGLAAAERNDPELAAWQVRMATLQRAPFADGAAWPEALRVFRLSDHLSDGGMA